MKYLKQDADPFFVIYTRPAMERFLHAVTTPELKVRDSGPTDVVSRRFFRSIGCSMWFTCLPHSGVSMWWQ